MSEENPAPGGMSWSGFKALSLEVGSWVWGTAQGAFNEKASTTQIIVDAVIGVIPVVGDGTAIRDLIAVIIGMIDEEKKREDKWQWVLLVVLLLALVPVVGGIAKGVGRLTLKAVSEGAHLASDAERLAHLGKAGQEMIAFLNHLHIGSGNAEKWLLEFRFSSYLPQVTQAFNRLAVTLDRVLTFIPKKLGSILPDSALHRLDAFKRGIAWLSKKADSMIPEAIKELDQKLKDIQAYIRSGGQTTSKTTAHAVSAGDEAAHTLTDEARLVEGGEGALRSLKGGWQQNPASTKPRLKHKIDNVYKHEPGYPDLLSRVDTKKKSYTNITTYAGKVTNRELRENEQIYRVFGPADKTHGYKINESFPGGKPPDLGKPAYPGFWGLGPPPRTAEEWRLHSAVLDEWNHNGYIIVGTVQKDAKVKACTGRIAEQVGNEIPGQYLPGGANQAMIQTAESTMQTLATIGQKVQETKKAKTITLEGISYEIRPTGWKDVNGVWGYSVIPGPGTVTTVRLGAREQSHTEDNATP